MSEESLRAAIDSAGAESAEDLLPLVYDELRRLAEQRLRGEPAGQTLQATALVHEAYLRVLGPEGAGFRIAATRRVVERRPNHVAVPVGRKHR